MTADRLVRSLVAYPHGIEPAQNPDAEAKKTQRLVHLCMGSELSRDTARAMSQENVEVVKELSERFAAGDRGVYDRYFAPEIVWDASASGLPAAGIYHGRDGVRAFFRDWLAPWADYEISYLEWIDAGDAVVSVFRQAGTGRGSGVRLERDFFAVWDFEEAKAVRFRLFETREQALAATGLSE